MEQSASSIRRQVYLLSEQDLRDCPIWEFCSDEEDVEGQDEATVRPSGDREVLGYSPGCYIVASDVVFADGSSASGYVYSGMPKDYGCIQPNVVIVDRQVNFWLGRLRYLSNLDEALQSSYQLLSRNSEQIFPATFTTRSNVNGSQMQTIVEGFMGIDDNDIVAIVR